MSTLFLLFSAALARPDDGVGLWQFSRSDEVASLDSQGGLVRVWYSAAGPNVVQSGDADADGLPDFAEAAAETAEAVLAHYQAMGFRAPLSDEAYDESGAFDVYLLDFDLSADGAYATERCTETASARQCSGYYVMENDFSGYGYASDAVAITTITSHELFHAIQAAYDAGEASWWSEGTATWAEVAFDPGSEDMLRLCEAYLDEPTRSLDHPPVGAAQSWAYGTALWWWFLTDRYGDSVIEALLLATETGVALPGDMALVIGDNGGTLAEDWSTFARWNLATGRYAGAMDSYPFASDIGPPARETAVTPMEVEDRFYPLAATYFVIEHAGGPLDLTIAAPSPDLALSLHPADEAGRMLPALDAWSGEETTRSLGEIDAGTLFLVLSNPTLAEDSTRVLVCLGAPEDVAHCAPVVEDSPADTGERPSTDKGCACDAAQSPGSGLLLAAIGLIRRRRR